MTSCMAKEQKLLEAVIPLGDYELRFEHKEFGEKYEEKARKELRENEFNVHAAFNQMRRFLSDDPELKLPDDFESYEQILMIFLRPCKFYADSAFLMMRRYYKFKLKHPKYYDNLLPSFEKAAFEQSLLTILPLRNMNGERILIIEAGRKWVPKTCTLNNIVRSVILVLEAALAEPRTQVAGAHVILDMEGLSLQHVWQFTPSFAKDIVTFVQECIPIRLKGVHIANQPYLFNMLFAIFKPFLGEKLRNRIHFHGNNFTNLHNMIDKNILPLKYDGNANIPMNEGELLHTYLSNFEPEFKVKAHEGYVETSK